jgi:hypothetical protein
MQLLGSTCREVSARLWTVVSAASQLWGDSCFSWVAAVQVRQRLEKHKEKKYASEPVDFVPDGFEQQAAAEREREARRERKRERRVGSNAFSQCHAPLHLRGLDSVQCTFWGGGGGGLRAKATPLNGLVCV